MERNLFETVSKNRTFHENLVQKCEKRVEIEGVGPIWRDPPRNSAEFCCNIAQNGWMATHLVTKRCDFGLLGFRARLAHPNQPNPNFGPKWLPHPSSPRPKGVRARPGTPRDPKSHLFVTKWVAIRPFCVFLRPVCAEFRSGARQIGLTPSISTFCSTFF